LKPPNAKQIEDFHSYKYRNPDYNKDLLWDDIKDIEIPTGVNAEEI